MSERSDQVGIDLKTAFRPAPRTNGAHSGHFSEAARCGPTRKEAEAAVRTLIRWAGDDPARAGLSDTPARVVRAYEEWFAGYRLNPAALLNTTFDEIGGYGEPIELRNIAFDTVCEHHMAPIRGRAHIAYVPAGRVIGISKLARVVHACSRRLQIQERLTQEIATIINDTLEPRGVAVVLNAEHACMTSRGVLAHGSSMITKCMLGEFATDQDLRREFLAAVASAPLPSAP